jgi:hypothetical protein
VVDVVRRLFNLQVKGKEAQLEQASKQDEPTKKAEVGTRQ